MEVDRKKSISILIIYIVKYILYGHKQENLHNCIDSSAITLPHASKPWLPSNVPYLEKVRTPQRQNVFELHSTNRTEQKNSYMQHAGCIDNA